jgi:hypothetical protein
MPRAWVAGWTVEQYAERLLADGRPVPDVLVELGQRIDAHPEINGCCGNGCNTLGWLEPFPCPTRRFYLAVRQYLSSSAVSGSYEPLSRGREPRR